MGPSERILPSLAASWDGDTINIARGTYRECFEIDKSLTGVLVSYNDAMNGGAIWSRNSLNLTGGRISSNSAMYGGGIYSTGNVAFDGKKVQVKNNKAHMPSSAGDWYRGYGVYLKTGVPTTKGGFDPAKQVMGNTKA